jgi:hypothetical protein
MTGLNRSCRAARSRAARWRFNISNDEHVDVAFPFSYVLSPGFARKTQSDGVTDHIGDSYLHCVDVEDLGRASCLVEPESLDRGLGFIAARAVGVSYHFAGNFTSKLSENFPSALIGMSPVLLKNTTIGQLLALGTLVLSLTPWKGLHDAARGVASTGGPGWIRCPCCRRPRSVAQTESSRQPRPPRLRRLVSWEQAGPSGPTAVLAQAAVEGIQGRGSSLPTWTLLGLGRWSGRCRPVRGGGGWRDLHRPL